MNIILNRFISDKNQTLGMMNIYNEKNRKIFLCATVELPWLNNKPFISCIPDGKYTIKRYTSKKYKYAFEVLDVKGRYSILIHKGNYQRDTEGCILVGATHKDIDKDGYIDVTSSRNTIIALHSLIKDKANLTITSI